VLVESFNFRKYKLISFLTYFSMTHGKVKLFDMVQGIKKETFSSNTNKISFDSLTVGELKIVEFIKRLTCNKNAELKDEFEDFEEEEKKIIEEEKDDEVLTLDYENFKENPKQPTNWKTLADDEYETICHSWFIVKDRNTNIDWKKPLIQHSQITSKAKFHKYPFSKGAMRYAYFMYDSFLEQNLVAKLPIKMKKSEYTIDNLSREIETIVISQHIANEFNDRIINHIENTKLLLNFVNCYIYEVKEYDNPHNLYAVENYIEGMYEKYNNNAGWISDNLTELSLVVQAFSHFSWQYTKGYMMIVDLQGVGGKLTDPQIHCINQRKFGKGNLGYYGILKFFLTHYCNEYCMKLNLVHPRKKIEIKDDFSFFVDKYIIPNYDFEIITRLCDLCRLPMDITAGEAFKKRKVCEEIFCRVCIKGIKSTLKEEKCIDCNEIFKASEFGFKMKRTDFPQRCGICRLKHRNRLREELTEKKDEKKDDF